MRLDHPIPLLGGFGGIHPNPTISKSAVSAPDQDGMFGFHLRGTVLPVTDLEIHSTVLLNIASSQTLRL
jgi:hypothetical protein